MTRFLTALFTAFFIAITQLMLPHAAYADTTMTVKSNSIIGFVFQDHDANGIFDDGDNTFATATVYLQKIGTTEIKKIMVDNSGYFEVSDLSTGSYSIWASHYGIMSDSHVVEVRTDSHSMVVTFGIVTLESPAMNISLVPERASESAVRSVMLPFIIS